MHKFIAVATVLLAFVAACSRGDSAHPAASTSSSAQTTQAPVASPPPDLPTVSKPPDAPTPPGFATVSKLINDAIAANKLPGAVLWSGTVAISPSTRPTARAGSRAKPG